MLSKLTSVHQRQSRNRQLHNFTNKDNPVHLFFISNYYFLKFDTTYQMKILNIHMFPAGHVMLIQIKLFAVLYFYKIHEKVSCSKYNHKFVRFPRKFWLHKSRVKALEYV